VAQARLLPLDDCQDDLFRPPLEEIINLRYPVVRRGADRLGLSGGALPLGVSSGSRAAAAVADARAGHSQASAQPPDEALCERWVENPYFQYFCGEVVFRHELPFDRPSLTRWRQRLDEEQIAALLQESLSVAHRTAAIDTKDLERVAIDTTVQERRSRIR